MNREQISRELAEIVKDLKAANTVYDVAKFMEYAVDDMKPLNLMVHSIKARIKDARGATLDKKVLRELDRVEKEVKNFEKSARALQAMIGKLA